MSAPPYPPQQGLRRFLGMAGQVGGRLVPFWPLGTRGEPQKPVDGGACNYVSSGSAKAPARFAIFKPPRFTRFLPHIYRFHPHAQFCIFARSYLSIYLFSEREERKEGVKVKNQRSTEFKSGKKVYPRIFCGSTPFLWMLDQAAAQCWRGFERFLRVIHTSTARNALGSPLASVQEVCT